MPRSGRRSYQPGRPKGAKSKLPPVPKSTREQATAAFEERFLTRMKPLLDATETLALKPDARMLGFIWEHLKGKATQSFELPTGSGIESVEVTYRIVNKSADA